MTTPAVDRDEFRAAYQLFAALRQRFDRSGAERGGCLRPETTPIYVRKFGEHAATIFPNLTTVESSFDTEQRRMVNATLLALKGCVTGAAGQPALSTRIVDAYVGETRPFFCLAMLRATETILATFLGANPAHAPVIDAIFCVAGSEGFRDLVRFYDARLLEHTSAGTLPTFPDILAFVNMHERTIRTDDGKWETWRFEVWCPGYDLAKEFHEQCILAARQIVTQHSVPFVPDLAEEVAMLPENLVAHFSAVVRARTTHLAACYLDSTPRS